MVESGDGGCYVYMIGGTGAWEKLERGIARKKDDKGLMAEWTNFVGALHGAAAAFLVDT